MDADTRSVVERLEAYDRRFEELLGLLQGQLPLHGSAKDQTQALLKSLKADLEAEYRKLSTVRGQEDLTDVERTCYAPVIHQTFAEISVATNSMGHGSTSRTCFTSCDASESEVAVRRSLRPRR